MSVIIPECQALSLDGIRTILFKLNQTLTETVKKQQEQKTDFQEQLKKRPTMVEILNSLTVPKDTKTQFTINFASIQRILNDFDSSIQQNIALVTDTSIKHEQTANYLVLKVQECIRICYEKHIRGINYSKKNLKFVHTHLLREFRKGRVEKMFLRWRKIAKRNKKGVMKLKKCIRDHEKNIQSKNFTRWWRITTRIAIRGLETENKSMLALLHAHDLNLKSVNQQLSDLKETKAEKSVVSQLEDLALKADLRVLFQDIKNIIKINSDNLKFKIDEENKSFSQDIRMLKDSLSTKADVRSAKEYFDFTLKLKNDFLDLSKSLSSLSTKMATFDSTLQKENTDFKISLIDRRIQAVEQRLSRITEDKSGNSGVISALYNLPSTRRPSTSKNRASIHSRAMSYQNN